MFLFLCFGLVCSGNQHRQSYQTSCLLEPELGMRTQLLKNSAHIQKTGTNSAMFLKFDVTEFVTFENIWCLQSPKMFLDKWMRLHSSNYRYTIPLIIAMASKLYSWINWCSTSISQNLRNTKGQGGGWLGIRLYAALVWNACTFSAKFGNLVNRVYNNLQSFTTIKSHFCTIDYLLNGVIQISEWNFGPMSLGRLLIMVVRQWL